MAIRSLPSVVEDISRHDSSRLARKNRIRRRLSERVVQLYHVAVVLSGIKLSSFRPNPLPLSKHP